MFLLPVLFSTAEAYESLGGPTQLPYSIAFENEMAFWVISD